MGCTGSGVQAIGNRIELFLAVDGQVRALWQVLTQQAVGVLTGAALPGTMRVADACKPTILGRRWVPPKPGKTPKLISGKPILVELSFVAIR